MISQTRPPRRGGYSHHRPHQGGNYHRRGGSGGSGGHQPNRLRTMDVEQQFYSSSTRSV